MSLPESSWFFPATNLTLSSGEVHVLHASLDLPASHIQRLQETLTSDELSRAERFYFPEDRRHFIVARGLLRTVLGRYLETEPSKLRFCYGKHGKPSLVSAYNSAKLDFNLSHSSGLALYAFTNGRKIGIDLECIRVDLEYEQIAVQFFSPQENDLLRNLPHHMKSEAFFNCWTRKESYIKARGEGLSLALNQFDVSLVPGEPARLLNYRGDPQEASRWSLKQLKPGPGYAAALAVEGHGWRLSCWQWPE